MRQFKMQISTQKQITKTRDKNVATNKECIPRKMG